jgi:hypothetical protein
MAERHNEPLRVSVALDAWLMGGEQGTKPPRRSARQRIADLEAEYGAAGNGHDRLLRERAAHVERNRTRMLRDMREEIEVPRRHIRKSSPTVASALTPMSVSTYVPSPPTGKIDQLADTRRAVLEGEK